MRAGSILCAALLSADVAAAEVPSGQPLALWEVRWERVQGAEAVQLVLRALTPDLKAVDYDQAQADMDWLCATHGATIAALPQAKVDQIVVNLSDKPVPRGKTDPSAFQLFGIYSLQDGGCIWEEF